MSVRWYTKGEMMEFCGINMGLLLGFGLGRASMGCGLCDNFLGFKIGDGVWVYP